jgi:ABC-2 type transport system permease protein
VDWWILFKAWFHRELILRTRYAWDTAAELFTGYAVFVLLALGAKAVQLDRMGFGDTESGLIVGFTVLTFVMASYRRLAFSVAQEAVAGTLEQFAMSPLGIFQVWSARAASIFVTSVFLAALQLVMMMATLGRWLDVDVPSVLVLLVFIYASGQGVGFLLAGLAIVEKEIQQLFQLVSWTFLAFTLIPVTQFPALKFMPVAWGTELVRRVMIERVSVVGLPFADLAFLVIHGTVFFALGLGTFALCDRKARIDGTLGHY